MHLKTKFDYKSIPQNTLFNTRFMISLDAPRGENKNRKPLNISMVLDRSGSMHGEKLEYVKQAAATLVRQLGSVPRARRANVRHIGAQNLEYG